MSTPATDYARGLTSTGLEWLDASCRDAYAHFERNGFPKPRDEDWKYTRVASIENTAFSFPEASTPAAFDPRELDLGGMQMVFVDGHFQSDLSTLNQATDGISLMSLAEAIETHPLKIKAHLHRHSDGHRNAFSALNTALSRDGAVVLLEPSAHLVQPLHLLFIATGTSDVMMHPRILIVADHSSELVLIEHFIALADQRYFNNVLTEISLADNASLVHYKFQHESSKAFHVSNLDITQGAHSRFESHSLSLGAQLARHDLQINLNGPGAQCTLNGLYTTTGRQHVDYHTRIDHRVSHCTSVQDYKGILGGRSRGVFNGRVFVHKDAQRTDAQQSNRNLLLSRDAEIDTKPQLEIHADDVKCAHGATVGQLDEQMVYYLRSRGIDEAHARALLTYGFARDIVDRISLAPLREQVANALVDELVSGDSNELRRMVS